MQISEPMTLVTDYILAVAGCWFGLRLWRLAPRATDLRRVWAGAFWAMALAALLGGSVHGFAQMLPEALRGGLWKSTLVALGAASGLLFYGAVARLTGARWRRIWGWLLTLKFATYLGWVLWIRSEFRVAVVDYTVALVAVLCVHGLLATRKVVGARSIVVGVLVSFVAAGIQQAELSPHPSFNHNDLYHLVQLVGLWLLFRGARALGAGEAGSAR